MPNDASEDCADDCQPDSDRAVCQVPDNVSDAMIFVMALMCLRAARDEGIDQDTTR